MERLDDPLGPPDRPAHPPPERSLPDARARLAARRAAGAQGLLRPCAACATLTLPALDLPPAIAPTCAPCRADRRRAARRRRWLLLAAAVLLVLLAVLAALAA